MVDIDQHHLSDLYGISFSELDLVVPGVNRTYRLRHKDDAFYLRLYREAGRSHAQITAELSLLDHFPTNGKVNVSRPVPTREGALLFELPFASGKRFACLFRDVGDVEMAPTPTEILRFGEALAWLHKLMPVTVDGPVRAIDPLAIGEHALQVTRLIGGSASISRIIEQQYLPTAKACALQALPQGLCHGDAWIGNARISQGKIGFFDFDDFGQGALLADVGTAAWHLRAQGGQSDLLMKALLSGYGAIRTMSRTEREVLPLFIQLAELRSLIFLAENRLLGAETWPVALRRAEELLRQQ
jgi:Ser/Thr protein kinase RdoA (MazF antagonist)